MTSSLDTRVALNRPAVPATQYLDQPLYALLDLVPCSDSASVARPPLNLALVVDASATMHNFQLTDEEREFWMSLAISRDEMERGEADERTAIYWSGQTLADMQNMVRKPMTLACSAIKNVLSSLLPTDRITVIAFADRVHVVFSAQDWATFPEQCIAQLDLLAEQRLPVDIGTGTFMADALRTADESLQSNAVSQGINRMIILSDGIVQDAESAILTVAAIQDHGFAITTLGLGDEFDEEFLTRIADNSRGDYYYAADSEEITQRLVEEMTSLQAISVTDVFIAVRGHSNAVIQDIALVRPSMAVFDEVYTEDGWMRARVGDISSVMPASVIIQIAPAPQPEGLYPVAEVHLTWSGKSELQGVTGATIEVEFSDDPQRLLQMDPGVMGLVDRFQIFKYEREAQHAQERGDLERAKEKLGAATRELRKIGEAQLADDMENQIAALDGAGQDASRVKRIKATTRRLAGQPRDKTPLS